MAHISYILYEINRQNWREVKWYKFAPLWSYKIYESYKIYARKVSDLFWGYTSGYDLMCYILGNRLDIPQINPHPTHVTWVITLNQLGGCSSQGYRP